ncbi:MAG TPA: cytochrome P450 [Humisphaera sp.]|jgi:cytochrome P450|nr:cytochrome P450 [Humisphaera sp.]
MTPDLFSDANRRNPFPIYDEVRAASPVLHNPEFGLWMIFDYAGVERAVTDYESFSSRRGPDWIVFSDPPRHSKLRALISRAFTPRSIANLESRIAELSRGLLDELIPRGEMDLAVDYAFVLPLMVIAEMLGIPLADRPRFRQWNQVMMEMSHTIPTRNSPQAMKAWADFITVTAEMSDYLTTMLEQRRAEPRDDLITRLDQAQVDGQRLTHQEILGFFQGLLLAGSETTTNLINNAILCFIEHPDQLARLREQPELLPSAIEEVLRFRSPLQWMYRVTRAEVTIGGQTIPAGQLVLPIFGSANRDPAQFPNPNQFDITRQPNPHLAFGRGIHFCMGAPLARLEGRIALTDLLTRLKDIRLASEEPWEPGKGLHGHGPARLPIRFERA